MDHDLHATILIDVLLRRGLIVFYSDVDGRLPEVPLPVFSEAGQSHASRVHVRQSKIVQLLSGCIHPDLTRTVYI